jgi:beta-1,4-mannosyl-glycoprotein beta-1,4-N-acetylglucosaminyltransferase
MIIDCFIFNDELPMLKFRLKELNDVVDYFVLVESKTTHSGILKPLYYKNNRHLFNEYNHKIRHVIVDDVPETTDPWHREHHQRNSIKRGIDSLKLDERDLIIISDCDEIPDTRLLRQIDRYGFNIFRDNKNNACLNQAVDNYDFGNEVFGLLQDMYYYNLECKYVGLWWQSRILSHRKFLELAEPQTIRTMDLSGQYYRSSGWHFSYFGGTEKIVNKIKSFAHQELNLEEYLDIHNISEAISTNKDLYHREIIQFEHKPLTDNNYLPVHYKMLL